MTLKWVALAAALVAVALGSSVSLVTPVPSSITVTPSAPLTSGLDQLNAGLLGLSSINSASPIQKSFLGQPRAVVAVEVTNVAEPIDISGPKVQIKGHRAANWANTIKNQLNTLFGPSDYTVLSVNEKNVVVGDAALKTAVNAEKVDASKLKTKGAGAEALTAALRVAKAIKASGDALAAKSGPAVFSVQLSAATVAPADIEFVLQQLASSARAVYGEDAVIVELVQWEQQNIRNKRDTANQTPIEQVRNSYNVAVFASTDYPAMFAIVAGLSIILALAVLYIAVGLWNLDPGKDSIIYRMTTVRQKKD